MTNTRSKIFLPALLPPFQKQHPDIRVVIQEEQTLQRLGELVFTGEVDLAHRMAAAGYGSTLVGDMMAKYDNFYNSLSYYPISDPPFLWTFGFIWHPERYLSPAVHTFLDFMKEHVDLI